MRTEHTSKQKNEHQTYRHPLQKPGLRRNPLPGRSPNPAAREGLPRTRAQRRQRRAGETEREGQDGQAAPHGRTRRQQRAARVRRRQEDHQAGRRGSHNRAGARCQARRQRQRGRPAGQPGHRHPLRLRPVESAGRDERRSPRAGARERRQHGNPARPRTRHGVQRHGIRARAATQHQREPGAAQPDCRPLNDLDCAMRQPARAGHRHHPRREGNRRSRSSGDDRHRRAHYATPNEMSTARVNRPRGNATLTAQAGAGKPHAAQTGEPAEPGRTHARRRNTPAALAAQPCAA